MRGRRSVNLAAIGEALQRISQLVTDFPQIAELDINPFIVGRSGEDSVAADARIRLAAGTVRCETPDAQLRPRLADQVRKHDHDRRSRRSPRSGPGQRVFIGTGGAQPLHLVRALVARHDELADTEVLHSLTFGEAPYAFKELADHFSVNTFFVSANVREMIQEGYGEYTPISLFDIPALFESGRDAAGRGPDPGYATRIIRAAAAWASPWTSSSRPRPTPAW